MSRRRTLYLCRFGLLCGKICDTVLCQAKAKATEGIAAVSRTQATAHVQAHLAADVTAAFRAILPVVTHTGAATSRSAFLHTQRAGIARLARPMSQPVKKKKIHQETRYRRKSVSGKTVSFFKSRTGIEDVYTKRNSVEKNVLIIDCQLVLDIAEASSELKFGPKFFADYLC